MPYYPQQYPGYYAGASNGQMQYGQYAGRPPSYAPPPLAQQTQVVEHMEEVPQIDHAQQMVAVPHVQVERIIPRPVTIVQEREIKVPKIDHAQQMVAVPHVQ